MNSALPIRCSQVGEVRPLSCPSGHIGTETLGLPQVAIGVHSKVPSLGTERQLQGWQCPWVTAGGVHCGTVAFPVAGSAGSGNHA